jgi:glycosyltransferase involved in cell wall biosynthesis
MEVPEQWTIVVNSSINHSTGESIQLDNLKGANNADRIINLNQDYLSEEDLSALFYASDTVVLPYKVTSGSGVMFDALGHGIPFVASDLPFFNEFAAKGLGVTAKRMPSAFTNAFLALDNNYNKYKQAVEGFKKNLRWSLIVRNHIELYHNIIRSTKTLTNNDATTVTLDKSPSKSSSTSL